MCGPPGDRPQAGRGPIERAYQCAYRALTRRKSLFALRAHRGLGKQILRSEATAGHHVDGGSLAEIFRCRRATKWLLWYVRIAAHLRTVLAAHVALKLVGRRRLRPANDIECNGLVRVAAEVARFQQVISSMGIGLEIPTGPPSSTGPSGRPPPSLRQRALVLRVSSASARCVGGDLQVPATGPQEAAAANVAAAPSVAIVCSLVAAGIPGKCGLVEGTH